MAVVTALSMSVTASAEIDNDSSILLNETVTNVEPDDEGLVLISSEERELEDGYTVEVNTFLEDRIETYSSNTGHKYYKCTASFKYDGRVTAKVWVNGTFYWDEPNNRAYVVGGDGDHDIINGSYKYHDKEEKTGDDVGGYWGGKRYSYVEYLLTVLSTAGTKYKYKLSFDVDVTGEYHIKTSFGTPVDTSVEE